MNKQDELEKVILNLESQRAILGDATVDAAIAALKIQLKTLEPAPEPLKQRKQVSVLFADVSGFTAMSEMMDAEDVQTTMNALWEQVDQAILDHNGRIDKHIGDAVMALWGVDEAREDDPEQAIWAALGMQTAVKLFAVEQNLPLKMRIGINTGPVLLGEVGTTAEFTAMGDAVNVASRLEHAAPIGGILISHDSYRHVRGVFDVASQDPLIVKGKTEPLQVYVVQQVKARAFRPTTRGVEGVEVRMVGRDAELEALQERWQTAVSQTKTTLITIIGDAGVGKSRLLHEFGRWLDKKPESIALFRGRSAEQTKGTPHFLLRDLLATRFEIQESDPIATVRQKFEKGIGELFVDEAEMKAHILGQWLGYDFGDSPHLAAIQDDAEQLKNRGLLYLSQFWAAIGAKRPLILFLEDIHWADASSLDVILEILRREPSLPLLVVALTRPSLFEHRSAWRELGQGQKMEIAGLESHDPAYHFLTLSPLPSAADRELLAEILQKVDAIPESLFEMVAGRAEGNPFYMEELVKMLIDNNVILTSDEIWRVDLTRLVEDQIPGTLTGVLQARLDRLEPNAKETLQRASVVGRVFWDTAVKQLGDERHQVHLRPLQTREFIHAQNETAFTGTIEYLFKHDLLRDVTYQTVLKEPRHLYHGQVAAWLVEAAEKNGRSDEYAALIGEHYQAAGLTDQAASWYGRAGKRAVTNFAHEEAIHYLTLALQFTPDDDHAAQFLLLESREQTYNMQGNREAQQCDLEQLTILAAHLSAFEQAATALRQATYAFAISDYDQTVVHAKAVVELGLHEEAKKIAPGGYRLWGKALVFQMEPLLAEKKFQMGLRLARESGNQVEVKNCYLVLGYVAGGQRLIDVARGYYEQAQVLAYEIGSQQGIADVFTAWGIGLSYLKDYGAAKKYHEQALSIQREIGNRPAQGDCLNNLGNDYMIQGDYGVAKSYFKQSLAIDRESNNRNGTRISLNNLGSTAWNEGDYITAQIYYEQAAAICDEIDLKYPMAYCLVALGMIACNQKDYTISQAYFERSLSICRNSGYPIEGLGLHGLATIALFQGDILLAETFYQQAISIHQEHKQPYYLFENWAGLAKMKLAQGDLESARQYGQQILVYLKDDPGLKAENEEKNPLCALRFTWETLVALEQTAEADHVLALAAQIMQTHLDKNNDPALQEMYLNQPYHRVLWTAWMEKQAS